MARDIALTHHENWDGTGYPGRVDASKAAPRVQSITGEGATSEVEVWTAPALEEEGGKRGEEADQAMDHLGANLERIVRSCSRPVFVASRAFKPIERVLVAYDGGVSAMKAVDHLSRSTLFPGLSVQIAAVGQATPEVKKGLDAAQSMLAAAGIVAETTVLAGQPEAALRKLAEEEKFDLLVMGAYGHSRFRSLIIGSTTTATMRACKVPVVLIR